VSQTCRGKKQPFCMSGMDGAKVSVKSFVMFKEQNLKKHLLFRQKRTFMSTYRVWFFKLDKKKYKKNYEIKITKINYQNKLTKLKINNIN
jgi:hypothetical protein